MLPILFGDRLVGRIEPRLERAARTLRILGVWWETGFDPRAEEGFVPAMRAALDAYMDFVGATTLEWAPAAGSANRLFGSARRRSELIGGLHQADDVTLWIGEQGDRGLRRDLRQRHDHAAAVGDDLVERRRSALSAWT